MDRGPIECSQNLVVETTLDYINLKDFNKKSEYRPENMHSTFVTKLLELQKKLNHRN